MSVSVSSFTSAKGTSEYFLTATPDHGSSFSEQFLSVTSLYKFRLMELKLDFASCIYMNIYISEAENQEDIVLGSSFFKEIHESRIAVSILQLPPMFSKLALFSYHVVSGSGLIKKRISIDNSGEGATLISNSYSHHFLKGLTASGSLSARDQTKELFNRVSSFCKSIGLSYGNIVRTWIYLRDINRDYLDMVESRREVFRAWDLLERDKFPASTGIGGRNKNPKKLVLMDAIIIGGMEDEQAQRMEAVAHMSHAMSYGVTFERGLKVQYGDRDHLYISGTASIDVNGDVMHRNDLIKQAERTLENIQMLLKGSSSSIDELVYLSVYLKDPSDADLVKSYIKASLPEHVPFALLQAEVCRQEWLIEIEGMAISKKHHPQYNDF